MLSDWRVGRRSQNLAGRSFWEQSEQNFLNSLGNTDEKVFTVCGFEGTTIITEIQRRFRNVSGSFFRYKRIKMWKCQSFPILLLEVERNLWYIKI